MPAAPIPPDESRRIAALYALDILDTEPEERFDRITRLAQRLFGVSSATFTLIDQDRQWYKSSTLGSGGEDPRELSFCAHAILSEETTVVGDLREDERFADNPWVVGDPNIRFYAGHPVAAPGGERLGTLCVADQEPRPTNEFDAEALAELAAMVEAEISALSLAIVDELTALSNRRGFEMLGERLVAAAARLKLPITAVYADLDNLKSINDDFGHEAGDRAIAAVGSLLELNLRGSDLIARLGGDEFCALLVGAESETASAAADRLEAALEMHNERSGNPYELAVSVGLATIEPGEGGTLAELVDTADRKMLATKRERKGESGR